MKVIHEDIVVIGINAEPQPGQTWIEIQPQELVWGMANEYYTVVSENFIPISIEDKAIFDAETELSAAKKKQTAIIKLAYQDEENTATIEAGGNIYDASAEHLVEVYVERQLADDNSETEMVVFDVDFIPHTVSLVAVDGVMQQIRTQTKANRTKAKNLVRQINEATTVSGVEAIVW